MRGQMMDVPLLISSLIEHAGRVHGQQEIVSRTLEGPINRTTWDEVRSRCKKLAGALDARGIERGDRIGTLAWNTHRHLEVYFALSSMGAICHTLNPRLHPSQLVYIVNHAADRVLFLHSTFLPLVEACADNLKSIDTYVILGAGENLPETKLGNLVAYEDLIAEHDGDYDWPELDENEASALCYTSGTTGNPKGALYSHLSLIHI